ncbi:MAG TPA: hypothetical protein VF596_07760 [Pyrinomonadaceae bacterium]|jgi:Flp pilus assembly protein TadB
MLDLKDIVVISTGVVVMLGIFVALIAFVWWKFSGEKQARLDVLNSEEYKAMERAASAWKSLYEASQERVGLLEDKLKSTEIQLELAESRITRLEKQLGISPLTA